jgi:hypothetical protein
MTMEPGAHAGYVRWYVQFFQDPLQDLSDLTGRSVIIDFDDCCVAGTIAGVVTKAEWVPDPNRADEGPTSLWLDFGDGTTVRFDEFSQGQLYVWAGPPDESAES